MRRLLSAGFLCLMIAPSQTLWAATPPPGGGARFGFQHPLGGYDRSALQRGFQIYREVCATCHDLRYISFRNLSALGYDEDQIKAFAASVEISDGPDDEGDFFTRPGIASDPFPAPFANDQAAAAANGGRIPPDLSLIVRARAHGAAYLHALLTGYVEPAAGEEAPVGLYANRAYPDRWIGMPPPLFEDLVTYADGTPATVEQMSRDVTEFLAWAAHPELEIRRRTGVKVLFFLALFVIITGLANRRVWARLKTD